jgi:hypothetical protein
MAATTTVGSIKTYLRRLKDPRVVGRSRHLLVDIVVLAICGIIADCDDWREIVLFAKNRLAWFKRFLKLPHGVPSHTSPWCRALHTPQGGYPRIPRQSGRRLPGDGGHHHGQPSHLQPE